MERTLAQFDQTYPWGGKSPINNGEPSLPQRAKYEPTAGLRDLYCFWIDTYLRDIEERGGKWARRATRMYRQRYSSNRAGRVWLAKTLGSGKPISEENMKFLRAANQHPKPDGKNKKIWDQSNYDGLWLSGNQFGAAGPF